MDMLFLLGPTTFLVIILMLISQGLKNEVSELHIERSDLKILSEQDSLTGLYNRHAGENLISEYIESNEPGSFGVIICDIDHFKSINDTYGHDIGDATLREVIRRCHMRIRSNDLFIRWGGDEFLIVVLDADIKEIAQIAEQVREIIAAKPLEPG